MKSVKVIVLLCLLFSTHSFAGHWVNGNYTNSSGSRNYQIWVPSNYKSDTPVPVMVALHGCMQNPSQYAGLTRLNQKADAENFIVLYPNQATYANPTQCWNYMLSENQKRDSGEVSMVMGMLDRLKANYTVDNQRVYVQGISAGGSMTSTLMACYSEVFAAGAVLSGGMYKAATTLSGGTYSLLFGSIYSPDKRGYDAWACSGKARRSTPMLVFHGSEDPVVNPRNADQVVQQFIQTNDYGDDGLDNDSVPYTTTSTTSDCVPGGLCYTVENYHYAGEMLVQKYNIIGMGHAYSGGYAAYLFAESDGPDTTEIMWDFFKTKIRSTQTAPVVTPAPTPLPTIAPTPEPTATPAPTPSATPAPECTDVSARNYYHKKSGRAHSSGSFFRPSYFANGSNNSMSGSTYGRTTLRTFNGSYWAVGACP